MKYYDNFLKVNETHPGLTEEFQRGALGIKRTSKPFSRQSIDLTLEQTINANAANKLTGVIHSTNSIAARQRWCKGHSLKAKIITHIKEISGLKNRQDVTADLQKGRIRLSCEQLKVFISNINKNINPFSSSLEMQCYLTFLAVKLVIKTPANFY